MTAPWTRILLATAITSAACAATPRPRECPSVAAPVVVVTAPRPTSSVAPPPMRYDLVSLPRRTTSFARAEHHTSKLFPAPGGPHYFVSLACSETDDGSMPEKCTPLALAAHEKTPDVQRLLACYELVKHPVGPAQWKLLERAAIAGTFTAEAQETFGPDEVIVVVRHTVVSRQPIYGPRKGTGLDSSMTPPPIIGWKHVATQFESWGWLAGSNSAWSDGAPFPRHETTLHALDAVSDTADDPRPFADARVPEFDRMKLLGLYDSMRDDPLLRYAALVDLAIEAFAEGKGQEARAHVESARTALPAARPLTATVPLLEQALDDLVRRAADYDTDPCARQSP